MVDATYLRRIVVWLHLSDHIMATTQTMAWKEEDNRLTRSYEFKDFAHAFSFMTRVAFICEAMNHHPVRSNSWNKVHISLTTHDAGHMVTEKDRRLSDAIEKVWDEIKG